MDTTILNTKRLTIYLSTLQIGFGIMFVPEHKTLHLNIGVFEVVVLMRDY